MNNKHYDYIIAGAGCAGRSLAFHLLPLLRQNQQRLLLVDVSFDHTKNKTWCYWETENSLFEPLVRQHWNKLTVLSQDEIIRLNIHPYKYKMISSVDFYTYTNLMFTVSSEITLCTGKINDINENGSKATIKIDGKEYSADYIFNSLPASRRQQPEKYTYLLQHFKGWKIKTPQPMFDPSVATLMDFRVPQDSSTAFVYILPISANTAMVEYTFFSPSPLPENEYNEKLAAYIKDHLGISIYTILEEESGIIPMTDHPFDTAGQRVIPIGTTGGMTKPSSGYTFNFIQEHCKHITTALSKNHVNIHLPVAHRFKIYDGTLLKVLSSDPAAGAYIFPRLFKTSSPKKILRFLDNKSNILEECSIFVSLPVVTFLKAFLWKITRFIKPQ